jgi:hypothetical protein
MREDKLRFSVLETAFLTLGKGGSGEPFEYRALNFTLVRADLTALTITTSLSYFLRRSAFLAKGQDEVDIFLMIARVESQDGFTWA